MDTHRQGAMRRLTWLAIVLSAAGMPAQAEQMSGPDLLATGVAAFDETKDRCAYAANVEGAVRQLDQTYSDQYGARWEVAKRRGKASLGVLRNMATMMGSSGSTDDCKTLGIPVGDMLAISMVVVRPDPEIGREASRLSDGGGKALTMKAPSSKLDDQVITPKGDAPSALEASAADAKSTMREILARDLSPILTARETENDDDRFLTPDLLALFTKGARAFDADPYTGSQEATDFELKDLIAQANDPDHVVVTAHFDIKSDAKDHPEIAYSLVRSGGQWRVTDIDYLTQGGPSMRKFLIQHQADDQ